MHIGTLDKPNTYTDKRDFVTLDETLAPPTQKSEIGLRREFPKFISGDDSWHFVGPGKRLKPSPIIRGNQNPAIGWLRTPA